MFVFRGRKPNKGIQATALYSTSILVKTSTSPPPHLMPQPLGHKNPEQFIMMNIPSHYKLISLIHVLFSCVLLLSLVDCNGNTGQSNEKLQSNVIQPTRGDTLINSFGMEFIYIPAGEFMMGSRETPQEVVNTEGGKIEWYLREHPIHQVKISKGFCLGMTEVTQEQYASVMKKNPSDSRGDYLPVENVTWYDAVRFCEQLSKIEKRTYRLPTEAE